MRLMISSDLNELQQAVVRASRGSYPHYPPHAAPWSPRQLADWEREGCSHDYLMAHTATVVDHPNHQVGVTAGRAWTPGQPLPMVGGEQDSAGWPLHPYYQALLLAGAYSGTGALWYLGPNLSADAVVLYPRPNGHTEVLLIQRGDTGEWALPGGMVDPDEAALEAAARELGEEIKGLDAAITRFDTAPTYKGVVAGSRSTVHSWVETTAFLLVADTTMRSRALKAADDATAVGWFPVDTKLLRSLHGSHGLIVEAAVAALPT